MNDSNREVLIILLDRIEASGNPIYIPMLESWSQTAFKKVRRKIRSIIEQLIK